MKKSPLFPIEGLLETSFPEERYRFRAIPEGSPVLVVTGCSVSDAERGGFVSTPKKAFFPGSARWLMNASLPVAIATAEEGRRVVVQCSAAHGEVLRELLSGLKCSHLIQVLEADLGDQGWTASLDEMLQRWSYEEPIIRVDFMLYESYTADVSKPFVPTFMEAPENIGAAIARRISFFQSVSNYTYWLLHRAEQRELRVLAITALASYRPVSYLFADGAHKAVSSKFLQTWALEASNYSDREISIIELCPGVVDTGLYDPLHVRKAACFKAEITGFPFTKEVDPEDLSTWPMLSPNDLALISRCYLFAPQIEHADALLEELAPEPGAIRSLMMAGLSAELSDYSDGERPLYVSYPNYPWGRLPAPRRGYTPVFITPMGQRV